MKASLSTSKLPLLNFLQYCIIFILILYFGQSLLIPLSFGLLISFVLYPICRWLENRRFSRVMAIVISLVLFFILSLLIVGLMVRQFSLFTRQWPDLYDKIIWLLNDAFRDVGDFFNIPVEERKRWLNTLFTNASQSVIRLLPRTVYNTSVSTILFFLVPFYTALILYYRNLLMAFLYQLFPGAENRQEIISILQESIIAYYNFIKGMTIVYLVVGILNSIGLAVLGIPNPIFFGFIASILTFIPYVGITIGALLPMSIAWLTYDSMWYPLGIVAIFVVVQILEANIIFPLAVSFKLKINALATITVIMLGAIIWGASGMILFMPFTAIFKLIADRIDALKPFSILLGTNEDLKK
ncbi:AI-2E family transporter [Fulvivirgaceae bacterium BMA12]|uniref:AI-2E family transporter n=1 Tax=Agaribacillus aureus TaxID=3051825 RepID=A0ABT8LKF6_9BACT|nr:AI-2E family transporter [Fulvivirgaceae bacterium BMA12]